VLGSVEGVILAKGSRSAKVQLCCAPSLACTLSNSWAAAIACVPMRDRAWDKTCAIKAVVVKVRSQKRRRKDEAPIHRTNKRVT
jgi:hypothetical protein